jgi:hypothetical protein
LERRLRSTMLPVTAPTPKRISPPAVSQVPIPLAEPAAANAGTSSRAVVDVPSEHSMPAC